MAENNHLVVESTQVKAESTQLKAENNQLKSEKQQHEVQQQQVAAENLSLEEVQELRRELQRAHELLEKKPHLQVRVKCITSSGMASKNLNQRNKITYR